MNTREKLMDDMDAMENAMRAITRSAGADLWQNQLIWRMCKAIYDLVKVVEKLEKPSAPVVERHVKEAEWIRIPGTIRWALCDYKCSCCGGNWVGAMRLPRYCEHCGARMKNGG